MEGCDTAIPKQGSIVELCQVPLRGPSLLGYQAVLVPHQIL